LPDVQIYHRVTKPEVKTGELLLHGE